MDRQELAAVLHVLAGAGAAGRAADALAEAVGDDPAEVLESSLRSLGFRVRWMKGSPDALLAWARADLPLVGWSGERGVGAWIVDGSRMGRLRARRGGEAKAWRRPGELPDIGLWARVEPVLPASMWASSPGATMSPSQRLFGLLRSEAPDVLVVLVYAVMVGVLSLATPLAIQVLINQLAFGVVLQPILFLGGALLVFLAVAAALRVAQRYAVEILQRRVFVRAVADLVGRFTRLRYDGLDKHYMPDLANRFFDVLTLQKATATLLLDGFTALLQAGVGFAILALYHPALLVFDVLALMLVGLVFWPLGRNAEHTAVYESKAKYAVAGWLEELARHPLVFKLGEGRLGDRRADALTRSYLGYRAKHFAVFFRQYIGMQVALVVLQVVLLVFCGWLVLEGQLTLGQLVAAEFIVASALGGMAKFVDKLESLYDLLAGIDKLGTLLDLPTDLPGGYRRRERSGGAAVRLSGVTATRDAGALRAPISLDVPAGAAVGVHGPAGFGSSTLAEILAGVRRPASGEVLRDGVPCERLSADELFDEVHLLRAGSIVQGTVLDNVTLGRAVAPEAVERALEAVGLAQVVHAMPKGLATPLGVAGEPLSEAQVIDLFVARALVSGARLRICDGLLDGVDPGHRARLLAALRADGCTLVVLTEDPSLANACSVCHALTAEGLR